MTEKLTARMIADAAVAMHKHRAPTHGGMYLYPISRQRYRQVRRRAMRAFLWLAPW